MKNGKMIIAVIAVALSAAVSARAEEIKIDFDGKKEIAFSFAETLKSAEPANDESIKPAMVPQAGIPGRQAPEFTKAQIKEMDRSIASLISYVNDRKLPDALALNFASLLKNGSPEQKAALVFRTEGESYSFPAGLSQQNKGICSWVTEKVCEWAIDDAGTRKWVCFPVKYFLCGDFDPPADK